MGLVAEPGFTQHFQQLTHMSQCGTSPSANRGKSRCNLRTIRCRFGVEHHQSLISLRNHRFQRGQYFGLHRRTNTVAL